MLDLGVVVAGVFIGFLIGLTGVGGGALLTPYLILVLGVPPRIAVGTDLIYSMVTRGVGAWQHFRLGTADMKLVIYLALGSVPSSIVGVQMLVYIKDNYGALVDVVVMNTLAVVLVIAALAILARTLVIKHIVPDAVAKLDLSLQKKIITIVLGAIVGFFVGLTSVGSGSLIIVVLTLFYSLTAMKIVGTDVFHSALLVTAAGIAHLHAGNVNLLLAGNLLIGSIPGVLAGSRAAVRVPDRILRTAIGLLLLVTGIKLLQS